MIEKITIKINKKKVELSLDEAKKLYEDLNEMFGSGITYIPYYPYYPTYPTLPQDPWTYITTDNTTSDSVGTEYTLTA